jgi:hypothetical protein
MGSISKATWLSLATGWLATAATVAVLAAGPDEGPGLVLSPTSPAAAPLASGAAPGLPQLVTLSPSAGR